MAPFPTQLRPRPLIVREDSTFPANAQGLSGEACGCEACRLKIPAMPRQTVIDVDILEADPAPTFIIKIQSTAIAFEILFCNEAFRKRELQELVLADDRSALLFRSWAQATFGFETTHALGGRIWHAEVAGRNGSWKVVKATGFVDATAQKEEQFERCANSAGKLELSKEMENPLPFRLGKTHLTARLESMQRMMEMSEVGVFEYKPSGQLIHANDAWYRLRYGTCIGFRVRC